jgi:hypothetical protein
MVVIDAFAIENLEPWVGLDVFATFSAPEDVELGIFVVTQDLVGHERLNIHVYTVVHVWVQHAGVQASGDGLPMALLVSSQDGGRWRLHRAVDLGCGLNALYQVVDERHGVAFFLSRLARRSSRSAWSRAAWAIATQKAGKQRWALG